MSTEAKTDTAAGATTAGSLLDDILSESKLKPSEDAYEITRRGVQAFISQMLAPTREGERVDKTAIDAMVADVDRRISAQLNEILHNPDFQKLESAWRGLKFLIDRTDFRENVKIELLSVTKDELLTDFEDAPELVKSGLYRIAYSNEYGVFGGKPYGLMCGNWDIGPGPQDTLLMQKCAAIAAMSHAPFITNASPEFFGEKTFLPLPQLKDLKSLFEGPQYARWQSFRESEDSRYVGMCLLRLPYGEKTIPVKSFNFNEEVVGGHEKYLWGHASIALASRITDSFGKFRWAPNIIGPQSGG